ncbi:hypothetical protein D3C73_1112390 [compost metagenome]
MPAIHQLGAFGNPQQLARRDLKKLVADLQFEATLDHENHLVVEHRPGDLRTFPARETHTDVRRDFVADGSRHIRGAGRAATEGKVEVLMVDTQHAAFAFVRRAHSSLRLFHAAR